MDRIFLLIMIGALALLIAGLLIAVEEIRAHTLSAAALGIALVGDPRASRILRCDGFRCPFFKCVES